MSAAPWKPAGHHSVTAYLTLRSAAQAIPFYQRAFGAELALKLEMPDGTIAHAEIRIGDSIVMLAEENPEWGHLSPQTLNGSPVHLAIYVPDVDAAFARALEAGAAPVQPVANQFYGDRTGRVQDPYGYHWTLATHVEEVSAEDMQRRMEALFAR